MPLYPDFETEGRVVAKYILKTKPDAKIGVLYQNDDFGKDYLKGLRAGLGAKASQIVAEASYELADPTIDSQIVQLKAAGVDTLIEQSSAKGRGAIDPQGPRTRLEPAPHHRRLDGIGRNRPEARGPRSLERAGDDAIPQAARRPGMGQ